MENHFIPLFIIFTCAYGILALTGFGSTILILSAASLFMPVPELLPPVTIINLATIVGLVIAHRRELDPPLVKTLLFPRFIIMFPVGFAIYETTKPEFLRLLLAVLVIIVAGHSLSQTFLRPGQGRGVASKLWLYLAGLVHGLFVSGGPFLVYYASRLNLPKDKFRINLVFIWLILDIALLSGYFAFGQIREPQLWVALKLLPAAVIGLIAGDRLEHRISQKKFLLVIDFMLLVMGGLLLFRFLRG